MSQFFGVKIHGYLFKMPNINKIEFDRTQIGKCQDKLNWEIGMARNMYNLIRGEWNDSITS
jgi:hypothetical protein